MMLPQSHTILLGEGRSGATLGPSLFEDEGVNLAIKGIASAVAVGCADNGQLVIKYPAFGMNIGVIAKGWTRLAGG